MNLPEEIDGLPNICGYEDAVAEATSPRDGIYLPESCVDFNQVRSAFANALHMHQPLIPGGGHELRMAKVIGNLQHMMENQHLGDNHNAPVFLWCYQRMGEFIPELIHENRQPRIMLEYSGCLFHGLRQMGANGVIEHLQAITTNPDYRSCVEWLGAPWGHAVAPSTPVQDFRLHVRAWQHHFAAIFGLEALSRVRGFSPSEMALPNHPDVCYEFVRTLRECGYRWVLVQEHTIERHGDGGPIERPHLPHRLVAKSSSGETATIVAIIKTRGSDTKLVAQMQPYYEARGLKRENLEGYEVPPLVTQIADGENGGVMMNEFPPKYLEVMRETSGSQTAPVNVTEYLEYLDSIGCHEDRFQPVQPIHQHQIWNRFTDGDGPQRLAEVIDECERDDHRFHMEGGSWTSDISWVQGYDHVLGPMEEVSALFAERVLDCHASTSDYRFRNALFHLLMSQTSCYRYWGEGAWTEYGKELCRRAKEILLHDF